MQYGERRTPFNNNKHAGKKKNKVMERENQSKSKRH